MALAVSNSQLIDLGALPIAGYPFTLTGWFRVPSVSELLSLLRVDNTTTGSFHAIMFDGHLANQASAKSKVAFVSSAKSTSPMIPGQWHQVTGVFESSSLRQVYLDGGNMGSAFGTREFDGADEFLAGNVSTSDAVDIADIAVFEAILDESQIQMLASGLSPISLPDAPQILSYHDCLRRINRPGLEPVASSVGTPTVVDHPRLLISQGGLTEVQPYRLPGPYSIDQGAYRTNFFEQAQLSVAGVADGAAGILERVRKTCSVLATGGSRWSAGYRQRLEP